MAGNQDNSALERPPYLKGDDAAIPAGSGVLSGKATSKQDAPVPSVGSVLGGALLNVASSYLQERIYNEANRNEPDPNIRANYDANKVFDSIAQHADFKRCTKVLGGMACVNAEYNTGWIPNSGLEGFSASATVNIPLGGGRKR